MSCASLRVPTIEATPLHKSLALGATAFTVAADAVQPPASAFTEMVGRGQEVVNVGPVVSAMVKVRLEEVPMCPQGSVAVQ
jgi:hypothetical protein